MSNPIAAENQNTGTTSWQVTNYIGTQIAVYTDKCSYNPGDTVNFYASMQTIGAYTLKIYRMGWYSGTGGCLKATINNASGTAQGWYDSSGPTLHNCPTAISDPITHNWEAGWTITDTWTIPTNAVTGVYAAFITTTTGSCQNGCYFVVKGNPTADYVYIAPQTTDQAYNTWGSGYSLYTSVTVGVKVSFNRPNYTGFGCGTLFPHQVQAIHWFESMGYNLSYLSDIDVHANASTLLTYKAMLFAAHDEYWTKAMRGGVEAALSSGIGIANLGANNCYWQCRLENDNAGNANRTLVCYKCLVANGNYSIDPQYGVDNTVVTTLWRDPLIHRPENTLWGTMFSSAQANWPNGNAAWAVDPAATSPYLVGTGLVAGQSYGTDCVGYEWDNVQPGGPNNIQVIATSSITNDVGKVDKSQTTTYVASSGALVFATGSVDWCYALDGYRYNAASVTTVPGMQQLMAHIMTALIRPKNPTGFSATSAFHA